MDGYELITLDNEELRRLVEEIPVNADVFDRLKFLSPAFRPNDEKIHFVLMSPDRKIVAAGSVQVNPQDRSELWMTQVSVDPSYKKQGHGKKILEHIFNFSARGNYVLSPSSFEQEGFDALAHVMTRLHKQYPDLRIKYPAFGEEILTGRDEYTLAKPENSRLLKIQKRV